MQADYLRLSHLLAGPVPGGAVAKLLPGSHTDPTGTVAASPAAAHATVVCLVWMAPCSLTEPVPLAVMSPIPAWRLPPLGVAATYAVFAPCADPQQFPCFGGGVLAAAINKRNLRRRLARALLSLSGGWARRLVLALMTATAFISRWLSHTATAVLAFPIALSQARHAASPVNLRKCLVLAAGDSATIGSMGTLIGTPPKLFVAPFLRTNQAVGIDFLRWLAIGLPAVLVMLPATCWLLTRRVFPVPGARVELNDWRAARWCGRVLTLQARTTLLVFGIAAAGWMGCGLLVEIEIAGSRPIAALLDTAIALFAFPPAKSGGAVLHWDDTCGPPWGMLLLFGGGLSLAAAISASGVDRALGAAPAGTPELPVPLVIAAVAATVIFVSEIASNVATAAAMPPLLAAAAPALGIAPVETALVTALAASSADTLPVGTAPNALAHGGGIVSAQDIVKAGLLLTALSVALITAIDTLPVPLAT
jgi:sodium-dependent dicarboxylate transporter 2/3/5